MLAGLHTSTDFRRKFWVFLLGGLLAFASSSFAQAQFKVPGTHPSIQDAVNACPANTGCVITLSDPLYKLPNTLLIYEKSNITIKGALGIKPVIQFQDQGLLAGPYFTPADSAFQIAGWKQWPNTKSTAVGGSLNTSNPYSTSGYQQNGVILIKQSSNITLDNVVIDGVAPLPVGYTGIWDTQGYPTLLGNFGVNLFLAKEVTIRNSKITNCFAGMYIFGRNKGGAMARNNQADLDKDQLLPNSQFGYSGQHLVEYSELASNIWGVYVESDWDLGSTFHHNLIYNNYNKDFSTWMTCSGAGTGTTCPATAPAAVKKNSEAANHAGGFMYGKDFVTVPYKIYNNTFYQNAAIFGWGMWRASVQHLVYNNLITNPYFDYNKSKTGLKSGDFKTYFDQKDLISKYTDGIYNNTFAIFPDKVSLNSMKVSDSAPATLSRSDLVFPSPRLQVNLQTQKLTFNFQATQYTPPGAATGTYITLATPYKDSVLYWSQANVQYQKQDRNFPYQSWVLSTPVIPPASLPTKKYSVLGLLKGIVGPQNTNLPAGVKVGDTIAIMDQPNQQSWTALDSVYVKQVMSTWTDTLGRIDSIGTKDMRSHTNWFIKSVPFQSLDPKSPKFLEPIWEDPGVDSVILDHGRWGIDPDGSIADVGAKSKSKGVAPTIVLKDGTQAKYDSAANTIRFSFDLVESGGNFVNYQYYIFTYASAVSDADDLSKDLPYNPKDLALSSIISPTPKPGANGFEAKLSVKPDPRSRYQVMVVAQTAAGDTIYSNMGVWLYKNDGFDMNVMFFDKVTGAQVTSARVGQTVVMRVRPVISRDATIRLVNGIKYFCRDASSGSLTYLSANKDTALKSCTGITKRLVADTSWRDSLDAGKRTSNVYTGTLQMVQIRATGLHDVAKGGVVVDPADIFRTNVKGETDYDVFFTVAGPQIVGANGKDTIGVGGKKASFSGDGKILVRPGLPYMAQFQDPPSVLLADTGFMTQNARVPVKVTVFDSVGNLVDTSSNIAIEITTALGGVSVVGGDPSVKTMNLHLDSATGVFWARTFDPVGSVFFLKSKVVVRDSARVKVMPPKESLKWAYTGGDSIFRYLGKSAPITLSLVDGNGAPALDASAPPFTATLTVSAGLRLALPSKPDSAITSIDILRAGTASVSLVVLSDGPVSAGSLAASNPGLDDAATFQPVTFQPPPVPPTPSVDSAVFRDVDCDGSAEAVRIYFKKDPVRRLKDSIQVKDVVVKLPFSSQVILGAGTKVVDADSSILDVALTTPVVGTTPSGSVSVHLSLKRLSLGDTLVNALATGKADTVFGVSDRVGPRLVPRAVIWENVLGNPRDTLRIILSEPVVYTKPTFPLLVWNGGVWKKTAASVLNAKSSSTGDTLELDVTGNDGLLVEKAVVRLDPAADLVDASGNHASDCAGATDTLLVYVKPIPMVSAAIFDVDGNGAADQIHVRFAAKLTKAAHFPDSLVVSDWCDFCGTRSVKLGASVDSVNFTIDIAPFAVGQTTGKGLAGQGTLTFRNPMQNQTVDLVDSVGPIPKSAALRFGIGADTLRVVFSEPVSQLAGGSYLMHQSGQALGLTAVNPVASATWIFTVPSVGATPYPAVGDSVYLPNLASRLVGVGGVIPTTAAHPPRVVVQGGDRIPDSATVLDRNGDGTADAVRLVYSSPLRGNPIFTFTWGGVTVSLDSTTYGRAKDSVALTLNVVGFPAMVTADPTAKGTTQSVVADQIEPAQQFSLRDGVAPAIDSVFVSYGQVEGSPDTIRVWTTEPVATPAVNSLMDIGRLGVRKPFETTPTQSTLSGNGPFVITCSACDGTATGFGLPSWPDRARLQKGIVDAVGNAVADSSVWVNVYNGLYPTRYRVNLYPKGGVQSAVVAADAPLKKLPPVSAFILPAGSQADAVWTPIGATIQGMAQAGNPVITNAVGQAGFYGLIVEMNTSFDADFLAYDNLGVFVGRHSIQVDIDELRAKGMLSGGKYTLAVVMNGSNIAGAPVSSGVYMIRLISYGKQNVNGVQVRAMLQNKIFKVGYQRKK